MKVRRRKSISRRTRALSAAARRAPTAAPRSISTIARSRALPSDLDGVFYRVGPDPQYPKPDKYAGDIPFDGEGHVSMFRIKDGHVDYRTRYAQTQRWKAQHEARRSLFGMYRNPMTDDPSVQGLSRGTANTQLFVHHGKLLVFKEDSPPVAMDPLTLETIDDYYTFGGKLQSQTHTAHPKIDPYTGEYSRLRLRGGRVPVEGRQRLLRRPARQHQLVGDGRGALCRDDARFRDDPAPRHPLSDQHGRRPAADGAGRRAFRL